jgi:hypothetical protein
MFRYPVNYLVPPEAVWRLQTNMVQSSRPIDCYLRTWANSASAKLGVPCDSKHIFRGDTEFVQSVEIVSDIGTYIGIMRTNESFKKFKDQGKSWFVVVSLGSTYLGGRLW